MSDVSVHVSKLAHEVEEIRVRALNNIVSKLECGLIDEEQLIDEDDLFKNLIRWFSFESVSDKCKVLCLILRLVKDRNGAVLLLRADPGLQKLKLVDGDDEKMLIDKISKVVLPEFYQPHNLPSHNSDDASNLPYLSEKNTAFATKSTKPYSVATNIKLKSAVEYAEYMSTNNSIQKNMRSDQVFPTKPIESFSTKSLIADPIPSKSVTAPSVSVVSKTVPRNVITTTADVHVPSTSTKIRSNNVNNDQNSKIDDGDIRTGNDNSNKIVNNSKKNNEMMKNNKLSAKIGDTIESCFCVWTLPWQKLVKSDIHVLTAVENSLKNSSMIEPTCQFFMNVMLYDYPPEVFLQRRAIIKNLLYLSLNGSCPALNALSEFVKLLHNRILFLLDPSTSCLKLEVDPFSAESSEVSPPVGTDRSSAVNDGFYQYKGDRNGAPNQIFCDIVIAGVDQLAIPQFCASALQTVIPFCGRIDGVAAPLLFRLVKLLKICISDGNALWLSNSTQVLSIRQKLQNAMIKFTESISKSMSMEPVNRLLLISCACLFLKCLVPVNCGPTCIPVELEKVLSSLLIDPVLILLYKEIHNTILNYVKVFKKDSESDYNIVKEIHRSMKLSMKFIKEYKSLSAEETVKFFKLSLPSLVFHHRFEMINLFVHNCTEKFDDKDTESASLVIVSLLAHVDTKISLQAYTACHQKITTYFGPGQACNGYDPYPKLKFFISSFVLREVICHGMISDNQYIKNYSEEILILILKCQMLVAENSWLYIWSEITTVLPLLQSFANKESALGETIMDMFNPDVAKTIDMGEIQVLSANIRFLMSNNDQCREEAVARIMWLTNMTVEGNSVSNICFVDKSISGKQKISGIYEPGSMYRVIEVLKCPDIDDKILQSALTQLSVMSDDIHLHNIFIDENGLEIVISLLRSFSDGECDERKIILPVVTTLKNLARHSSQIRLELSQDLVTLKCIVKCLLKYHKKWRLQRDASQLLAFIVFAEFFVTTFDSMSLPHLIATHFRLPFECSTHWNVSPHSQPTFKGTIVNNKQCQTVLSVLWLHIESGDILYVDKPPDHPNPDMNVKLQVLRQVQGSAVGHNCKLLLNAIQCAKSHKDVHNILPNLAKFLEVCYFQQETKSQIQESSLWRQTFMKFLSVYPLSERDEKLLYSVLRFLKFAVVSLKPQIKWISEVLTNPFKPMLKLLISYSDEHKDRGLILWKELIMSLLQLCGDCCSLGNSSEMCWNGLTAEIIRCLHYTHTQHFYNLAFLGTVLGCLSRILTEREGVTEELRCDVFWELIVAFHCGTPNSCMGLSIIRQTLLILNILLHLDLKNNKSNKWETEWLKENHVILLLPLCHSRDVIVRSATLQLISGLCSERNSALLVLDYLPSLWNTALRILLDHDEASIVREHAAAVCTHIVIHKNHQMYLSSVEENNFFLQLKPIFSRLVLEKKVWNKYTFILSDDNDGEVVPTTPGFVKTICGFIATLLLLYPDEVNEVMKKESIVLQVIRCLMKKSSSDSILLNEVCEMYCSICTLLHQSIGSISVTNIPPDLIELLMKLLNENCYGNDESSLIVRDKLWGKVLMLLSIILFELEDSEFSIQIPDFAVKTICHCLNDNINQSLQQQAMWSITSICYFLDDENSHLICEKLILLWDKCVITKRKKALIEALTALLGHSQIASETALDMGLLQLLIYRLRNVLVTLAIETGDTSRLRKGNPILAELSLYLGLSCNFLSGSPDVKSAAANLGFADTLHKLWVWCQADIQIFTVALQTLITFTANCPLGARSLLLTSTTAGVGQRKTPSSFSLVHALINLITNNKDHYPAYVMNRVFMLLAHSCQAPEARAIIAKSNLINKFTEFSHFKKPPSEDIEGVWLKFMTVFSFYPEGQLAIPKGRDTIEQLMDLSSCNKTNISYAAISVLRNVSFHSSNRPRLLSSENFLSHLGNKLSATNNIEEKKAVAAIIWAMVANNQKAKLCMRSAGLDARLQLAAASPPHDYELIELFDFVVSLIVPNRDIKASTSI